MPISSLWKGAWSQTFWKSKRVCLCVWICVCLPGAALARLPPRWLYCVQTDASPTAEPAHCFNMLWREALAQLSTPICSRNHDDEIAWRVLEERSDRQRPLLLENGAYAVVSVDSNLLTRSPCLSNGQHSLVLNSSVRALNWVHFFFSSFCQRIEVITLQNIAFIQAFVPSILQRSALPAISST